MRDPWRVGLSVIGFLIAWELLGRSGLVPIMLFPPPSRVTHALWEMATSRSRWPIDCCAWVPARFQSDLLWDTFVSVRRALTGWVLGSVVGIAAGIGTGRVRVLGGYLTPIIQLFRPLPPVAIIPIVIVWFGVGEVSKLFSISFAVFFPVWINAHLGSEKIPQSFIWSAWSLGVHGWKILTRVILPGALPFIIPGLRTGIAVSFVMVYVSELAGASAGIGYEISTSQLAYRVDRMMGALVVLGMLGASADLLLTRILNGLHPWLRYSTQK
jgi:ABC-type nitrate/sulfonate/bicarbonate transport system permease component